MEMELLLAFLMFFLISGAWIIAAELSRPSAGDKVVIVFLENNEEISEGVLKYIRRKARRANGGACILVIDNYSTDMTVPVVSRMGRYFPEIALVEREKPGSIDWEQLKPLFDRAFQVMDFRDTSVGSSPYISESLFFTASLLV